MKLHFGYEQRPTDPNFTDVRATPLHEREIAYYLNQAWKQMHGRFPSKDTLAIIWSQVVLEAGRNTDRFENSKMRNYNYGNIKKNLDYSPYWTSYEAGEFLGGEHQMFYPYHPQTFFAAWKTPLEGALGYLKFLKHRKRYREAWAKLKEGDTRGYVAALKKGGYFTAPLDKYLGLVSRLTNEFKARYDDLMSWSPPPTEKPPPDPEPKPEPKPKPKPKPEPKSEVDLKPAPSPGSATQRGLLSLLAHLWDNFSKLFKR